MSRYDPPKMPYVEAKHKFGHQRPRFIILRGSFTTSVKGAALGVAQNWHTSDDPWWAGHYSVDEETSYRCVQDRIVAGTRSTCTRGAIRIAICAEPINGSRFWDEALHARVLHRTAKLVADLSLAYKVPVRYLEAPVGFRGGIVVDTTAGWPYESFLAEVRAQKVLKRHI